MGVTQWACPGCGQQQRAEHPNGEAQALNLCAACTEQAEKDKLAREGASKVRNK